MSGIRVQESRDRTARRSHCASCTLVFGNLFAGAFGARFEPGERAMSLRPTRTVFSFLLAGAAIVFGACGGSADDSDTDQATDAFLSRWPVHHRRECSAAFHRCLVDECAEPILALRRKPPFSPGWFRQFEVAKVCALTHCLTACGDDHGGTGGSGGSGGSAGTGGSTGGSGGVCASAPNACQACLCRPCQAEMAACQADSACTPVLNCGIAAGCSGVDCYYKADGSRGPCADVIDAAGGPASAPVRKALDVFRCEDANRPACSACN